MRAPRIESLRAEDMGSATVNINHLSLYQPFCQYAHECPCVHRQVLSLYPLMHANSFIYLTTSAMARHAESQGVFLLAMLALTILRLLRKYGNKSSNRGPYLDGYHLDKKSWAHLTPACHEPRHNMSGRGLVSRSTYVPSRLLISTSNIPQNVQNRAQLQFGQHIATSTGEGQG